MTEPTYLNALLSAGLPTSAERITISAMIGQHRSQGQSASNVKNYWVAELQTLVAKIGSYGSEGDFAAD
jgi:hypothetical protein